MTFSIIGTGNIAWFFGNRLVAAKHNCTGVYGRDIKAVYELADALLCANFGPISEIADSSADVCFLVVSDAAITSVAENLSFKETVLVHTAGAVSLDPIRSAANDTAVLWPVYSITKSDPPTHRNIPCAWEASSDRARRLTLELAHVFTDITFEAKYEQRRWLHLSAVISNNFTNHLLAICEQICSENNLSFSTLLPIIEQTFDRIKHASPRDLQTGPAARNDIATVNGQMDMLNAHPEWQKVYAAISESIKAGIKK
jgi:predicted short-subunit dehydrogenase-like oxidoreductase (DUF2520 family)